MPDKKNEDFLACSTDHNQFFDAYSVPPHGGPTPLPDGVNSPAQPGTGPDYSSDPSKADFEDIDPPKTMT